MIIYRPLWLSKETWDKFKLEQLDKNETKSNMQSWGIKSISEKIEIKITIILGKFRC